MIRRRLFNFVSAVSLLLCVGTVGLWVRSYWRFDWVEIGIGSDTDVVITLTDGELAAGTLRWVNFLPFQHTPILRSFNKAAPLAFEDLMFVIEDQARLLFSNNTQKVLSYAECGINGIQPPGPSPTIQCWRATVRLWMVAAVLALLPAAKLRSTLRHRTPRIKGVCTACRYNLTGNTSGVCPECGTPVSQKSEAVA